MAHKQYHDVTGVCCQVNVRSRRLDKSECLRSQSAPTLSIFPISQINRIIKQFIMVATQTFVIFGLENGFHRVFRIVLYRRLGSRVASSCNLSSPIWYDVNNNTITNSTRRNIFVSANNGTMVISSLTLEDAGVYFCVGSSNRRMYGTVIIYVRGKSFTWLILRVNIVHRFKPLKFSWEIKEVTWVHKLSKLRNCASHSVTVCYFKFTNNVFVGGSCVSSNVQ